MKIVFDKRYLQSYDHTPAGEQDRLTHTLHMLKNDSKTFEFIKPSPAPLEAIQRAHSPGHIQEIQRSSMKAENNLFKMASLAAGGAILSAEIGATGEPAFALIRPPGHHASYDSAWGFCYFNNLAIALLHLRETANIRRAFILDFDLHIGDGNIDILGRYKSEGGPDYEILNPEDNSEEKYMTAIKNGLEMARSCDIVALSAGFDQGIRDWGKLLHPQSYYKIGRLVKEFALQRCQGRRFAVLEGGYNPMNMAENIQAFLTGFM